MAYKKKSILKRAKENYKDYFRLDNNEFSEDKARLKLGKLNNADLRIDIIKRTYEALFNSSRIKDITKEWVRYEGSISETIENYNSRQRKLNDKIELSKGVAWINYDIAKLRDELIIGYGSNGDIKTIFEIVEEFTNITEDDYNNCIKMLATFNNNKARRDVNKGEININISTKQFSEECDDESFIAFLNLIKPFGTKEKRHIQDFINSSYNRECGYFNYIMAPDAELNDHENEYRNLIIAWLDGNGMDFNTLSFIGNLLEDKEGNQDTEVNQEVSETIQENKEDNLEVESSQSIEEGNQSTKEIDLRNKEDNLNILGQQLSEKEVELNNKELKLNRYKEKLDERKTKLGEVENELKARNSALDIRESDIESRENKLYTKEINLQSIEERLEAKEKELKSKEDDLNVKEIRLKSIARGLKKNRQGV